MTSDERRTFQREHLTLLQQEKDAYAARIHRSRTEQKRSRTTLLHYIYMVPLDKSAKKGGRTWTDLFATYNHDQRQTELAQQGLRDDDDILFEHRARFSACKLVSSRTLDQRELSRIMFEYEEGYARFARHIRFLKDQRLPWLLWEMQYACIPLPPRWAKALGAGRSSRHAAAIDRWMETFIETSG